MNVKRPRMMDNVTMKKWLLAAALSTLACLMLLSGCQTIRTHNPFRHRGPDYQAAQQEQPLEVPPGLDTPPTSEALSVPGANNTSTGIPPVTINGQPMNIAGATASGAGVAYPPASGNSLTLSDQPDSAYHRVGLALERGGVGVVSAHDDSAHTYQVAVNSVATTEQPAQGGFFHRLLHRSHGETRTVTGTVNVGIAPSGSGSVVTLQGDADAVERVLSMLQQRLGGS
ncbi:MAG: hypothetical protein ABI132_08235 [Rhodanobacteraceae bacterium]